MDSQIAILASGCVPQEGMSGWRLMKNEKTHITIFSVQTRVYEISNLILVK